MNGNVQMRGVWKRIRFPRKLLWQANDASTLARPRLESLPQPFILRRIVSDVY